MRRHMFAIIAALVIGAGAPRVAKADPVISCPKATLLYYLNSVSSCYQGNVQMLGFDAMLSILGGSGGYEDLLVVPWFSGPPAPGAVGFGEVGFSIQSLGGVGLSGSGIFDLVFRFSMVGDLYGMGSIDSNWSATADVVGIDPYYRVGASIESAYSDARGCYQQLQNSEGFIFSGNHSFFIAGYSGASVFSDAFYCRMINPVEASVRYSVQAANGIEVDWQFNELNASYRVGVTPEPGTVGLVAAGLGLLAMTYRRRSRQTA